MTTNGVTNGTTNGNHQPCMEDIKKNIKQAYKDGGVSDVTAGFYDQWSENDTYEKHLNPDLYAGPKIAAQKAADYFPKTVRQEARILDVAAGTGFVAECLIDQGFTQIDGLDPSEGMLLKARKKNVYKNIICCYVDENKLPILEDTYDCCVSSGGMGEGHIPFQGLNSLIRVVKPGGYVIIVMREEYLEHSQYKGKLEPHINKLISDEWWELVARTKEPNYCFNLDGLVYVFRVKDGKYENKDRKNN